MIEFDATGIEPKEGGGYRVVPEGDYFLRIVATREKFSTKGDPQVEVDFEVDDATYLGVPIRHWVTFMKKDAPGAGMSVHFLKCIGQPYEGDIKVDPGTWVGITIRAHVIVTKNLKGNDTNKIASIDSTGRIVMPKQDAKDEEVPF